MNPLYGRSLKTMNYSCDWGRNPNRPDDPVFCLSPVFDLYVSGGGEERWFCAEHFDYYMEIRKCAVMAGFTYKGSYEP
jgi:hypothetical protein